MTTLPRQATPPPPAAAAAWVEASGRPSPPDTLLRLLDGVISLEALSARHLDRWLALEGERTTDLAASLDGVRAFLAWAYAAGHLAEPLAELLPAAGPAASTVQAQPGAAPGIHPPEAEALRAELARLEQVRQACARRVATAREDGDVRENSGYDEARRELAEVDARLRAARATLTRTRLSGDSEGVVRDRGRAGRYDRVTLQQHEAGAGETPQRLTFILVGQGRSAARHGHIGLQSPLGRLVQGRGVGEQVTTPRGVYRIVAVEKAAISPEEEQLAVRRPVPLPVPWETSHAGAGTPWDPSRLP